MLAMVASVGCLLANSGWAPVLQHRHEIVVQNIGTFEIMNPAIRALAVAAAGKDCSGCDRSSGRLLAASERKVA